MNAQTNEPVTSYGIIIYKIKDKIPYIVMINRKDSLCYIDFLRGKYKIGNIYYIQILINKFSIKEKDNILKYSFDELWKKLWSINSIKDCRFKSDYIKGKTNFNLLKEGINNGGTIININYLYISIILMIFIAKVM